MLYGASASNSGSSVLFDGVQWGGLTADPAIFIQAALETALNAVAASAAPAAVAGNSGAPPTSKASPLSSSWPALAAMDEASGGEWRIFSKVARTLEPITTRAMDPCKRQMTCITAFRDQPSSPCDTCSLEQGTHRAGALGRSSPRATPVSLSSRLQPRPWKWRGKHQQAAAASLGAGSSRSQRAGPLRSTWSLARPRPRWGQARVLASLT